MSGPAASEGGGGASLVSVALRLLTLLAASAAGSAARRTAPMVGGWALTASLFAVSLGFFTFAAFHVLAGALDPIQASLILGTSYLLAGLFTALVLQSRRRRGAGT